MASICPRCGHTHIGPPLLTAGPLHFCLICGTFILVRELGEMVHPSERADPDEWGSAWL